MIRESLGFFYQLRIAGIKPLVWSKQLYNKYPQTYSHVFLKSCT